VKPLLKGFTFFSQIISTHLLTVLTMGVILHLEQGKQKHPDNSKVTITAQQDAYYKGGMTYDDVP